MTLSTILMKVRGRSFEGGLICQSAISSFRPDLLMLIVNSMQKCANPYTVGMHCNAINTVGMHYNAMNTVELHCTRPTKREVSNVM